MILYHGTNMDIETIDLSLSLNHKDSLVRDSISLLSEKPLVAWQRRKRDCLEDKQH